MQDAQTILVIIVSAVLTLFLVMSIIVLILLAKLITSVKRVVDRAEDLVESASEAALLLRNASGPLALFKVLRNVMKAVEKARK